MAEQAEMTQAAFARHMNVSRARVTQWKKSILTEEAFAGEGKSGKVIIEVAARQVEKNRDISQALGNGLNTRTQQSPVDEGTDAKLPLGDDAGTCNSAPDAPPAQGQSAPPTVEDQIKTAKLEAQLRKNRMDAQDEALRQGLLMSTDDAREQMTRIAGSVIRLVEGALPDLASAVSEKFGVPQRDVVHLLRQEFTEVRKSAAKKERERAEQTSREASAQIDLEG